MTVSKDVPIPDEIIIHGFLAVRKDYNKTYRERLDSLLNEQFQKLTSYERLKISLMEDMRLKIRDEERDLIPEQMGESMQTLLSLAIRFAWIKHLADQIVLPVFLDDPLIGLDSKKRSGIEKLLEEMAHEHQIVFFTIDETCRKWGDMYYSLP